MTRETDYNARKKGRGRLVPTGKWRTNGIWIGEMTLQHSSSNFVNMLCV